MAEYEIKDRLGGGAMGEVHRAWQVSLRREVALKRLHPDLAADQPMVKRFRREALLASRITHPNVVRIFDSGVIDGRPYLAMELVDGQTLARGIDRAPAAVARRADALMGQVLDGLDAVHAANLIHRDIKPVNIMVTEEWRVVLMDFGLVRDLTGVGTMLTREGALLGTPLFMAPEVLAGQAAEPASDLWSIGCIYHLILTGHRPFQSATLEGLLGEILDDAPRNWEERLPNLEPNRRAFLARLLDRDPAARFPGAREARRFWRRQVIGAVSASFSARSRRPGRWRMLLDRVAPWVAGRTLTGSGAVVAGGLLLAAAMAMALTGGRGPDPAPDPGASGASGGPGVTGASPAGAARQELLEALRALDPEARDRAICLEKAMGPQARKPEGVRRKAAEVAAAFEDDCRQFRLPEQIDRLAQHLDQLPAEEQLALYEALGPLRILRDRLEAVGLSPGLDPASLFPPGHRPLPADPPGEQEIVLFAYDPAVIERERGEGRRLQTSIHPTREARALWVRGAGFPGGTELWDMLPDERTKRTDRLETPVTFQLRPVRPGETVVLKIHANEFGPAEHLEVSFVRPGRGFRGSMLIRGDGPLPAPAWSTSKEMRTYRHSIHPSAVQAPARVSLTYRYCETLGLDGEVWIHGISVAYISNQNNRILAIEK